MMGVVEVMPVQWGIKKNKKKCELEGAFDVGDARGYCLRSWHHFKRLWTYPRCTCMSKRK